MSTDNKTNNNTPPNKALSLITVFKYQQREDKKSVYNTLLNKVKMN